MQLGEFRDAVGRAVPDAEVRIITKKGEYGRINSIHIELPTEDDPLEYVVIGYTT